MTEQAFIDGSFTAPPERRERLTAALAAHLPEDSDARILDLGCGNGRQLLDLAAAFPRTTLVGIDTSRANVETARRAIAERGEEARAAVEEGDYLELDLGAFDVILSDSVLQNIPAADERLYGKLAGDIRPGGLLVASLPYGCAFNRALWLARRVLRLVRGAWLDRLVLSAARRMHPTWDEAMLRERVPYMYMVPHRIDDARMVTALAARGLDRIDATPLPHASVAQPRHRLSVFRRRAAP